MTCGKMVEGDRTSVWCRRCAGYAEHKIGVVENMCGWHRKREETVRTCFHSRYSFCLAPVLFKGTFLHLTEYQQASERPVPVLKLVGTSVVCLGLRLHPELGVSVSLRFYHGLGCWAHCHVDLVPVWFCAITFANPMCAIEVPR